MNTIEKDARYMINFRDMTLSERVHGAATPKRTRFWMKEFWVKEDKNHEDVTIKIEHIKKAFRYNNGPRKNRITPQDVPAYLLQ